MASTKRDEIYIRQQSVARRCSEGEALPSIARDLRVTVKTIRRDLIALGLRSVFASIDDAGLDAAMYHVLQIANTSVGRDRAEAHLLQLLHARVPRGRILASFRRLGIYRTRPMSIRRVPWYESGGPNG